MQARHDRATSRMSRLRHLRRRQSGTDRSLPGSGRLREQERSCGRSSCVSAEPTPRPGWELLAIPDLVALDLPALAAAAGYPGTRVIPATSWLLSLLALKLTATRRVSHVDDLIADPAPALLAGLSILPKKTALTDYSYRLSHDHQRRFLAALDKQMISKGLATAGEAIFDLDFHAVMHWGEDPALEKHSVPSRSQRTRPVLTFFARDTGTHNLVYANADLTKAARNREVIAFCDHWRQASGSDPKMLIMDQKVTTQPILGEIDIGFGMPASPLTRPSPGGAGASSASNSPDPRAEVPVRKSALRAQQARVRRARVCGSARAVPSWPGRFPRQVHPQGPARTPGTASGPGAAYPACCGSASACGARLPGTDLSR